MEKNSSRHVMTYEEAKLRSAIEEIAKIAPNRVESMLIYAEVLLDRLKRTPQPPRLSLVRLPRKEE